MASVRRLPPVAPVLATLLERPAALRQLRLVPFPTQGFLHRHQVLQVEDVNTQVCAEIRDDRTTQQILERLTSDDAAQDVNGSKARDQQMVPGRTEVRFSRLDTLRPLLSVASVEVAQHEAELPAVLGVPCVDDIEVVGVVGTPWSTAAAPPIRMKRTSPDASAVRTAR